MNVDPRPYRLAAQQAILEGRFGNDPESAAFVYAALDASDALWKIADTLGNIEHEMRLAR